MGKIIIANHKMNMSLPEIKDYIDKVSKVSFDMVICPTSIYAPYFIEKGIKTGLQNICFEDNGPFTGEISGKQAKDLGAEYVIIGHSERRRIFEETNDVINLKIKKALENDLKVILCIGDNTYEDKKEVLKKQITEGLKDVKGEVIISYEPVYSIGTDIIPSREELTDTIKYIKSLFDYDVKVIYGGSVNLKNALELKDIGGLSGYLVGTASLDATTFIKIGEVLL